MGGTYAPHKFAVTGGKEKSNNTLLVTSLRKLHNTFAYLVNTVQQWFYAPMFIFMHQKQFFNSNFVRIFVTTNYLLK
jgi:hypothetical protein